MNTMEHVSEEKPVMPASFGIAREGYPFIAIAFFIAALAAWLGGPWVGVPALVIPGFVLNFFRDPERIPPEGDNLVISPADGKVISVEEVDEARYLSRRMKRVCVFMNVFNVHVNRVPVSGRVQQVRYNPGKFLMGYAEKASLDNEQNAIVVEVQPGREILFIQIAGLIARRIVCYLKGGECVRRGERFGLIRFGSRVDIYFPLESEICVKVGEKVTAGASVIGRLTK